MQFIDLQAQYRLLKSDINARIQNVLDHGNYVMGPEVRELEEKLATFIDVKHAITCANGTDALTLSLLALGIKEGDVVITTPFTFFATAEVITFAGAIPMFVDIDENTFNISPVLLEQALEECKENKKNVKAVITVDLFGLPAAYDEIEPLCKAYGVALIEDSAQGFAGEIANRKAGSFGNIATTSFFPAKPLGCYGDGGAIFTNDDEIAEKLRSLRVHGKGKDKYDNVLVGMNSRLDTIQAAILLEKLAVYPKEIELRQEVASRYSRMLSDNDLKTPVTPGGYKSVWAQYSLVAHSEKQRTKYMDALKERGIPSVVYYGKALHLQTALEKLDYKVGDFPIAERISKTIFSLPMHPYLSEDDQILVVDALKSIQCEA